MADNSQGSDKKKEERPGHYPPSPTDPKYDNPVGVLEFWAETILWPFKTW